MAAAKHFAEPDSGTGPRRRHRLSFSAADNDEEGRMTLDLLILR